MASSAEVAKAFTPYSTAKPYFGPLPQWLDPVDAQRIQAYQLYEEMYWNANDAGVESQDSEAVHIPVAKGLVEAIHRFLLVGWDVRYEGGTEAEQAAAKAQIDTLFKREQFPAKVSSAKRYGLIRGDAMFHVVADPEKPAGSRISIYELDPATYFPIYDLDDPDRITGCHLIEMTEWNERQVIRRQTYRKEQVYEIDEEGRETVVFTGRVTSELALFELSGWDDRFGAKPESIKRIQTLQPVTLLPEEISQLPVYHWKNTRNTVDIFGSSAYRGLEGLLKKIDQTITDQDLGLALASLGVYVTDSGAPKDGGDWVIGPGRVVEVGPGSDFKRVPGITSIAPSVAHADYLEGKAREGLGISPIAAGDVDVSSAESGIALFMKLMPLIAANSERELEIIATLDQLLFDLTRMWFPAYEGVSFGDVMVVSTVQDPMPVNREAVIEETVLLLEKGLITMQMAIDKLATVGWVYPKDALKQLVAERRAKNADLSDPDGARIEEEAGDGTDA